MAAFEKIIEVSAEDLDALEHVNNVRYVQWIQDISEEHWRKKAPEDLVDKVAWVVQNHNIDYKSAARLGDRIRIKTYVRQSSGATSIRVVEMYNESPKAPLVFSRTTWCLLNAETQKPMRITDAINQVFTVFSDNSQT